MHWAEIRSTSAGDGDGDSDCVLRRYTERPLPICEAWLLLILSHRSLRTTISYTDGSGSLTSYFSPHLWKSTALYKCHL
jgi:hypothetical protein